MENEEILTLPDTQVIESQTLPTSQQASQHTQKTEPEIWGILLPLKDNFKKLELINDSYTLGRSLKCDVVVNETKLSGTYARYLSTISKFHFCISKEMTENSDGSKIMAVKIQDLSQNGTYVNEKLIGRGNKITLKENDIIGLSVPKLNVYMFAFDEMDYPLEVKSKYVVSGTLGHGACGEVKLIFCKKTYQKFAMKIISKMGFSIGDHKHPLNDPKKIMNEVNILKQLKHPCVIKMEDIIDKPSKVYIILELMEGGELLERIQKTRGLTELNTKVLMFQVVLAVQYLHKKGITHRDLKPENILLASHREDTLVKVTDFGLSKFMDAGSLMKSFCGTPMYVAPEVLKSRGFGAYTQQVDVWSLGVILYCCLSGRPPFTLRGIPLQDQIMRGLYNFNVPKLQVVSKHARSLIKQTMTVDAAQRITIDQVLLHPWLQDRKMQHTVDELLRSSSGFGNENKIPFDDIERDHLSNELCKHARLT